MSSQQQKTKLKEVSLAKEPSLRKEKTIILPNKKWLNDVNLILYPNGEIAFSTDGAENWIYLYPNQVKKLRKILKD